MRCIGIKRDIPSEDVKDSRPIRERLPLPDLGMMRRMMQNIHKSNQNAEIRDKTASQKKLEVGNGRWYERLGTGAKTGLST